MEKETLIINKLDELIYEVAKIKEQIVDLTLDNDDLISIKEAEKELSEGQTQRLD